MSEQANDNQELDQGVDLSRRKLAKVGAAAPVIMTLASKPVFGAQCLSQMMSGNMSQQGNGGCDMGFSPGAWKGDQGGIDASDWSAAGFEFGEKIPGCSFVGNEKWKCFTGGISPLKSTSTLSEIPRLVGIDGYDGTTSLLEILYSNSILKHCVTAYLNASLLRINYILSQDQVLDLCDGTTPYPDGYGSLNVFFDATWL